MTPDSTPDVSIIIVSWNTSALTTSCLASLPAAARAVRWEAWVIDNASTDDSVAAIRTRYPDVHLVANATNVGFAAANNQGIRASTGRFVLLLNSDTVMAPLALDRLVAFADDHPRAGVVGPMLVNPDGSYQTGPTPYPSVLNELLSVTGLGRRVSHRGYPSRPLSRARQVQRTDYVGGACMLGRRAAIDEVGGLDEGYFMYSEEPDWCWRMRSRGWEVWYTPDATVTHFGGQSTHQAREAMVIALYRSKVRFMLLHRGWLSAATLALGFSAISKTRLILRRVLGLRPPGVWMTVSALWPRPDPVDRR